MKPIEEADRDKTRPDIALPPPAEEDLAEAEEEPIRPAS